MVNITLRSGERAITGADLPDEPQHEYKNGVVVYGFREHEEMEMTKVRLLASFIACLGATAAAAADPTACDKLLADFDAQVQPYNVSNELAIQGVRTQAQELCLSGDQTAAEEKLDQAVAELETQSGDVAPGTTGTTTQTDTSTGTGASGSTTGTSTDTGSGATTTTTQ